MCGIAGIWHLNRKPLSEEKLKRFTDSLSHRGPDAGCYWINDDKALGLGHRRLSILDLSAAGNQPMSYANGRYKLIYNGEVFNFLELRKELEAKGYFFNSSSDSEVILAAYDHWGHECLNRMNGMWAFAIYDIKKNELFLARDRFGIKPLNYLYIDGQMFALASETYAFKFLDDYKRSFNDQRLSYNIADPFALEAYGHTIFDDIYQLLPGHYMHFSPGKKPEQKRWWSTIDAKQSVPADYEQQVEQFREIFYDAVKLRLRSDVPIASALSGGLDSSSVYCTLYHIMNGTEKKERTPDNWQKAFVAAFPGTKIDETTFAKEVVDYTGGRADFITPDFSNLADQIRSSTLMFDSIYNTPISAAHDIYGSMRDQNIKVSMDGHGVDEMLFGYGIMIQNVAAEKKNGSANGIYNELVETVSNMHYRDEKEKADAAANVKPKQRKGLAYEVKQLGRKYLPVQWQKALSRMGVVGDHFSLYHNRDLPLLTDLPYDLSGMSPEERIPFESFHLRTLPTILRNFDRTSMQNSVEIRMPFMDYRLVSYVFSLPFSSKVNHGFSKRILRDAMKGLIPERIRLRRWKVGFNAPMPEWFSNELSSFILDEVNSEAFRNSKVWNGKRISAFAEEKIRTKSWTWDECVSFWPVFNAHLLMSNNRT